MRSKRSHITSRSRNQSLCSRSYHRNQKRRLRSIESKRSISSRSRSHSPCSDDIDDTIGHFEGKHGTIIIDRYTIIDELGTGTFGKVFYCNDKKHRDKIALKVVRNITKYRESAEIEAKMLRYVYNGQEKYQQRYGNNKEYCMKMYSHFNYNGHYCLVCEPLGKSLLQFIELNDVGFPLSYIREIARQLMEALKFFQYIELIHTDLKMENILFVSNETYESEIFFHGTQRKIILPKTPKIKLIDFGGSLKRNEVRSDMIINTRQYRSPEVILECGWSYPSDMWSAGCIIAEIYSSELLFPTHEDLEHLAMIEKCIGRFPTYMKTESPHGNKYFQYSNDQIDVKYEKLSSKSKKYVDKIVPFEEYFTINSNDRNSGIVSFMKEIMAVCPRNRCKPEEVLKLDFFKNYDKFY